MKFPADCFYLGEISIGEIEIACLVSRGKEHQIIVKYHSSRINYTDPFEYWRVIGILSFTLRHASFVIIIIPYALFSMSF